MKIVNRQSAYFDEAHILHTCRKQVLNQDGVTIDDGN